MASRGRKERGARAVVAPGRCSSGDPRGNAASAPGRLVLLLLAAACSGEAGWPQGVWSESVTDLPQYTGEVVSSVAALPECGAVPANGLVEWRPQVTCGTPPEPASGCAHPSEDPLRIEVVYQPSAWDGRDGDPASPLAFQLCRICGYTDGPDADVQASACAMRAKLARSSAPSLWEQVVASPPTDTQQVIAAVEALPECGAVRSGGVIHWRRDLTCGSPAPVSGCTYPWDDPPRIEIVYTPSAWDAEGTPGISTLAHELCHVCGYVEGPDRGEAAANDCASRAQALAGR